MRVLGVAGALRRESYNRTLLRAAGSLLPPEVHFTEYGGLKLLPPFDEDDELAPALAVAHWRDAIAQATRSCSRRPNTTRRSQAN